MLFMKKEKTNKKLSHSFSIENQMSYQVQKEFKTAIKSYLKTVKPGRLFINHALYDIPWFMITGPENSGKSTVLAESGLSFQFRYPIDNDDESSSGIKWFSGNNAIWLDFPGKLYNSENNELFESVYQSLAKIRRKRPVDCTICIIDIGCIINGSQQSIRKTAKELRSKYDEMIRYWGIELPVFCIFSKMDSMPGFTEYFYNGSEKWSDQILGATFANEGMKDFPRIEFNKEYEIICNSLKSFYLKRSAKENNNNTRRLISQFLVEFEGIKKKIGDFFEELFKDNPYEGKPVFKGFYFVSCNTNEIKGTNPKECVISSKLSQTIICHPLNPHRNEDYFRGTEQKSFRKPGTLFIERLFFEVFPSGIQILKGTRSTTKKGRIKYYTLCGVYSLVFIFMLLYLFFSYEKAQKLKGQINEKITKNYSKNGKMIDAYTQMQNISEMVEKFRTFHKTGVPLSYGIGFVKTERTYDKLKRIYIQQAYNLLSVPMAAYLESCIKNISASNYNLTYENYLSLYRYLKTYLSISEEVAINQSRIDTVVIRETIENDFFPFMINLKKIKKLPMNLETILKKNIGLYNYFLKTGEMPLIQQNPFLVKQARNHLAQIPDAKIIYESLASRLQKTSSLISIGDGVILSKKRINTIYTQEGWDKYVKNEISISIKNPIIIDWVTGENGIRYEIKDEKKLKSDLDSMYIDDVCREWLSFLESVYYQKPEGISGMAQFLRKLTVEGSDISVFLDNVIKLSKVNTLPKEKALINAAKSCTAKNITSVKKHISVANDAILKKDTLSKIDQFFKPLMVLVRSQGLSEYKEKLNIISDKMISCAGSKNFLEVFNGTDQDPLLNAWRVTEKLIMSMPEYLQPAMISVIRKPLEMAAETIISLISEEINDIWYRNVYNFYNSKLSGKYPFYKTKEDAPLDAAIEFLRPNTGILFGFILNNLSFYLVRDGDKWKSKLVGCINLQFNELFYEMIRKADKISSSIFNSDGSLKVQSLYFISLPGNKIRGTLNIGKQEYKIVDDKLSLCLQWPSETQENGITLSLFIHQNYTDELKFKGDWAIFRLFESAQVNIQNSTSMIARWERNIQNMIILPYGVQVKFSETVLPFGDKEFFSLKCPEMIVERDAVMSRIAQSGE